MENKNYRLENPDLVIEHKEQIREITVLCDKQIVTVETERIALGELIDKIAGYDREIAEMEDHLATVEVDRDVLSKRYDEICAALGLPLG